jgi:hypothetical protein
MLLDKYMQSDEYIKEIEAAVDSNPDFRAKEKIYLDTLKSLNLDIDTYDLVDMEVVQLIEAARELAYKKGFSDGVNLVAGCVSRSSKTNDELVNWFIGIVEKDPIQAYRIKEIIELLCSLSEDDQGKAAAFVKNLGEVHDEG